MAITKPPVLPAWADAGDKVQPSNAELSVGWPVSSTPPSRQRFNWALNFVANAVRYFSRRGLVDYDVAETYMIGDRVIGDDGKTYKCLVDNTIAFTPSTNPAKWARWGFTLSELNSEVTTPAQFDNTTKVATTAFVKAGGVSFASIQNISASRNLAVSDIGAKLIFQASATLTIPSPASLGLRPGDSISVSSYGGNLGTVAFSGCTYVCASSAMSASITVGSGESLTLIAEGGASWEVGPSTAGMGGLASFGASLASNGYQKLPSGLIIQWGFLGAGPSVPVTFPIAFPTAAYIVNVFDGGYRGVFFGSASLTTAGFTARCSVVDEGMCWFAIGK